MLDLGLPIVDRVWELKLKGDGLACKGLDKDLHTATALVAANCINVLQAGAVGKLDQLL